MSTAIPATRHVRGFDVVRPFSLGMVVLLMLSLVLPPPASVIIANIFVSFPLATPSPPREGRKR